MAFIRLVLDRNRGMMRYGLGRGAHSPTAPQPHSPKACSCGFAISKLQDGNQEIRIEGLLQKGGGGLQRDFFLRENFDTCLFHVQS